MLEATLDANSSTAEMLETTQDANSYTGDMLETTQDANYSKILNVLPRYLVLTQTYQTGFVLSLFSFLLQIDAFLSIH